MSQQVDEKPTRTRTFLKEWRLKNHLTQAQAGDRLGMDQSSLSRIERGVVPYDQDFLEAAAYAYNCTPADLLMRNPLDKNAVWSITDNLLKATPEERARAIAVVDALLKNAS